METRSIRPMGEEGAATALAALGNRTRLRLFRTLVRAAPDGLNVGDLQRRLGLPGSTLAHHLSTLARAGLEPLPCRGTYFVNVDIRSAGFAGTDEEFCRAIIEEAGVAAIPLSAFYRPESADIPRHFARFCFAKRDAVLDEAARRLADYAKAGSS